MVRETRHLWVGNLPDNVREDRIREHFKRYGRVQNAKLLGRTENVTVAVGGSGNSGVCATVAFMDIKSASKAHNAEHVLDERTLTTEYYEPAAIPSAAGAPSAGSSPAGSGYSGSSSSVNSTPAPASVSRYHMSGGEDGTGTTCPIAASAAAPANWRGTNDSATEFCRRGNTPAAYGRYQRNTSTAPYSTPPSNVERTTPHHRWYASGERVAGATGGESTPSTPGGGTESGRRRRHSGSGSSRSDSSSPEPSDTSRASTPAAQPSLAHHANHRAPHHHQNQWAATSNGRPLAICVRNLPTRSTDSSLKDGLYHEYKKHGKVVWVKVVGQNADRYAVVRFKKPSDVEKALEVSQDKLFFGCKISVAPHQSCDEDADTAKPYETDIDEYHPKATRTLFIGNLEKDVTQQQLRDKFKHFGRIIEIDIKKGSGGGAGYAFCQYASISSVVEAIRAMDGEYVGGSRAKLGFGKPVATTCVWVDGLTEHTEKQVLGAVSRCGAATSVCVDRAAGAALVHFEQAAAAGGAVRELRRVAAAISAAEPDHPRLCVDYASRECQEAFYEQLEKHGGSATLTGTERLTGDLSTRYLPSARHEPLRYDGCGSRSRASSYGRGSSRTQRYPTLEHYDPADYAADRRYRVYDELGSSPQTEEAPYEDRLQSVVVSPHRARRHRRDSSPEERKHSKDRHSRGSVRRSRSGSRGAVGERHGARRRHRRRREGSESRAGTPLRDELDAPPAEPRRPPRDRPPLPMSLPLPKFAAQLLRAAPPTPRPQPAPALAPDSPPRPPSASSSSAGSAPHSPSLEERIRSLDEKYEKWSGSRALADTPDRSRLRHRLLEVDINEVKPSEVVRSLLAKRSVFDEDSERLEGAVRVPSPAGSPRSRLSSGAPRTLLYPYPAHGSHLSLGTHLALTSRPPHPSPTTIAPDTDTEVDQSERPTDPRLNRPERPVRLEKLGKFNEIDYRLDSRTRPRTPSTDRSQPDSSDRGTPGVSGDAVELCKEGAKRRHRESLSGNDTESKCSLDIEPKDIVESLELVELDYKNKISSVTSGCTQDAKNDVENEISPSFSANVVSLDELKQINDDFVFHSDEKSARDVMDMLLKQVEQYHDSQKTELQVDRLCGLNIENNKTSDCNKLGEHRCDKENDNKIEVVSQSLIYDEKNTENLVSNYIHEGKETSDFELQQNHLNSSNSKISTDNFESSQEINKGCENTGKERYNHHDMFEDFHNTKFEKENIDFEKSFEKEKYTYNNITQFSSEKNLESEKKTDDRNRSDRDKVRHCKERFEKDTQEYERSKGNKNDKVDKIEKDKKLKEEIIVDKLLADKADKIKIDKDTDKVHKDRRDERDCEKSIKHANEKLSRHDHHSKKDKSEKDKRKEPTDDALLNRLKKDERHKHERSKKDSDSKRDSKKESESIKVRKSSRDETARDICRKDSTDSSTSRASHESSKVSLASKEPESNDSKEELKSKSKHDLFNKQDPDKDFLFKSMDKFDVTVKIKTEIKEEKDPLEHHTKNKTDNSFESNSKSKSDFIDKQRHYSLDSPSVDNKRKERLNSCSSLPSNIGQKRRMSSQDSFDSINDEMKKNRNENKFLDRRDSKDSRKTTKFSKGHFAKIIESKTKDDKKTQVKPPDDALVEYKDDDCKSQKHYDRLKSMIKKSPKQENEKNNPDIQPEGLHNDIDFLATLELRSSEEDERQKALRKEMKEKKRIQQLQQIQEQQAVLQQAEFMGKLKDDKKQKLDEKKKETAREKRFSTDRKSREERIDGTKRQKRKQTQTSDSSDSDEPKKHSIFDIIDDGPTYISMYDKVKARSCKNMQKQEEEKRQEKIKAKFSQLKQSRAKREEKKRSSWDEDSDSEQDGKKPQKISMGNSSDDEDNPSKKQEKSHMSGLDYDISKSHEYFDVSTNEEDVRNKLFRKNSRTRIMSDTSDDDTSKRSTSKSPHFLNEMIIKKEPVSDSDSLQLNKIEDANANKEYSDNIKKNSLLNLFGKSDSDDSRIKCSVDTDNDFQSSFAKCLSHDFSSESESVISNRAGEVRKKHKKKQKKHKSIYSDDESKVENKDFCTHDGENKHKIVEKPRRHSHKKEKRKDKIRDSVETDDTRDEKIKLKKDKKSPTNCLDFAAETSSTNIKKDGKMEDIFGPLSDESDRDTIVHQINKSDFLSREYDSNFCKSNLIESRMMRVECKVKEKDENKRKKEKKRKDKRTFKDDDNSLDVDAVSKAIEARLFADSMTDDENRIKNETLTESNKIELIDTKYSDSDLISDFVKHEKLKKDCKEKKKKKKKNKEDKQNRKEHHHFYHQEKYDKSVHVTSDEPVLETCTKTMILDIPLPTEIESVNVIDKPDNCKLLSQSPSLPRITDSPPTATQTQNTETKNSDPNGSGCGTVDTTAIDNYEQKIIDIEKIPMPPCDPPSIENIEQDISKVPLPPDSEQHTPDQNKIDLFISAFSGDVIGDAARSISNIEKEADKLPEKSTDKIDTTSCKVEKKLDEKPRAIISQEETEDAVAALLGESFGGKIDSFSNCYDEADNTSINQNEIERTVTENENIPEEDAEEMRQAVQNLNASEMEIKPDTPVSDNDLLLIDTDTEEVDETAQDAIERLPVNIIATNQSLNTDIQQAKPAETSNMLISKPKQTLMQAVRSEANEVKYNESEVKIQLAKRDNVQIITSTATPVITSWTLTNNKMLEPHLLNIQASPLAVRDKNESKPTHITANIVQIKPPQNQNVQLNNSLRPIVAPTRVGAPYQVINQMTRPQGSHMQPPTIKIPEPHILYQKQQGIVISPRMSNDPRMQSPKASSQGEGMTSPRLTNMAILSTSPQSLNSVSLASPNAIQQRSPGHVTVVRMQQPPLSPIQAMHISHGARAMVSPNRPNSVLVQTQGTPIHFNRLPVTPVLAPISKQMNVNNIVQQNKGIGVSSPLMHQQKIASECRKNDQRNISESMNETSKIILSPTSLQHSTNPTVMAQNRLISMQNALHVGNINSALHLNNKVLVNSVAQINEKRENQNQKSEQLNHMPFGTSPIIHVAGVNHASASIIQSSTKPIMCLQETNPMTRSQNSNVIHNLNPQRLLTPTPLSNVIQIDSNKGPPTVLSMASIRSPTVLTKGESSNSMIGTTGSIPHASPLLLKTSGPTGPIRLHIKEDTEIHRTAAMQNHILKEKDAHKNNDEKREASKPLNMESDSVNKDKQLERAPSPTDHFVKCGTDFEELLKDKTNEIKVTNDPEKKLEVNVGKNVSLFTAITQHREKVKSIDCIQKESNELAMHCDQKVSEKPLSSALNSNIKQDKDIVKDEATTCSSKETNPTEIRTESKEECNMGHTNASKENNSNTKPLAEIEEEKTIMLQNICKVDDIKGLGIMSGISESIDNQIRSSDENDSWSAKDVNIESVIKKVDSLCNEIIEEKIDKNNKEVMDSVMTDLNVIKMIDNVAISPSNKSSDVLENIIPNNNSSQESAVEKTPSVVKRGGRSMRGRKSEKNQDRVQTRQISKPPRGATSAKRGRGRAKIDKKIKSLVNNSPNTIPGDVYDFHEDSGDETASAPNKTESRPRLILTIKSPLSGNANMTPTSTLSITHKDQLKNPEKTNKDEKIEDFITPSLNTRKSRRLQEKDVQRSTVDDVIEDVVKGAHVQSKTVKETNKKRQTRQAGYKTNNQAESKVLGCDIRKSPRGVKRTRDRSFSDASIDSGDEKIMRIDDGAPEPKVPRLEDPTVSMGDERDPPAPARTVVAVAPMVPAASIATASVIAPTAAATVGAPAASLTLTPTVTQPAAPTPITPTPITPTPITKPPKKMISEISAKLACVFEAQQQAAPSRDVAPGEAHGGEAALARRPVESVPAALMPVGATEATDARVQSPALPHRPPSTPATAAAHRTPDRATPVLIRGGEGESGAVGGAAAVAVAGAGAGVAARAYRGYLGAASLPRGAHHPPPPDPLHPHVKQVAVVGPHTRHHHPGTTSRVTITSVPSISPQGQMSLGDGVYPHHFSHQHFQMYQQHFRATQHDSRASPSPFSRTLEAEGCEAPAPPLELRRPPSARVPRPAHSPAHADRLIRYGASAVGGGVAGGGACGRSPPPAHAHGTPRLAGALPPATAPGPPHASQVPREADSLQMLLRRYPVMWQGLMALKNDSAAVQMHFVGGNPSVARDTLWRHADGSTPPLRIAQRMRLEPAQLDQVHRKMKMENEHCMLLALPCGRDHMDVLQQSNNLTAGFITYLQRKQAAGIVNVAPPGHQQAMFTVHIFPSCDFANENLNRIAPDLMHRVADIAHLLIVIATV